MITLSTPNSETLAALGLVAVRHGTLEYILQMTVKSLTGVSINEAVDATAFEGPAVLRKRINGLAKRLLGDGIPLIRLQAILERCRRVTEKRNEIMHNVCASTMEEDEILHRTRDHQWKAMPGLEELRNLANEIAALVSELNEARLSGFLFESLKEQGLTGSG